MSELISPKQASKILGVCPNTLRIWEELGKIKAVRTLGGHRRYKIVEINLLLKDDKSE